MKINLLVITALLFFLLSSTFAVMQEQEEEFKILQSDHKILIDGKLDEWSDIREIPVVHAPDGKIVEPSSDLAVTVRFTFDKKNFYAAVDIKDNVLEFPNRKRRNGDGFYLVFIDPYKGEESDRFYIFGFSGEKRNIIKVLINKDGEFIPGLNLKDIEIATEKKEKKGFITYELAIPWKLVLPLKPFFYDKWGINLIYDDFDKGKRTQFAGLYPDQALQIEQAKVRKGAVFEFVKHPPEVPEFQSTFNATHFYHDEEKILTIAVHSPIDVTDWKIRYELSSGKNNISNTESFAFKKGLHFIKHPLKSEAISSGFIDLSFALINDKGSLKYVADHGYFVLNREELKGFYDQLKEAEESEQDKEDGTFKASLPSFEIRLEWIKDFLESAHPFAFVHPLITWFEELQELGKNIEKKEPALFPTGQMARLAHRSSIDNTLQSYSLFVPPTYTGESPLPLFVTLHSRGVDERSTLFTMMRAVARRGNYILLAPGGRGLSDWYLGDSAEDVIECINHVKKIYNIDEENIILDGFEMGGYGAWRLSLLYPEMFKAAIIRFGAIAPPSGLEGENILDLLERGKGMNFFIVHGDEDMIVSVENARRASQKLTELGIFHEYVEVKGAGHGEFQKWHDIFRWLNKIIQPSE